MKASISFSVNRTLGVQGDTRPPRKNDGLVGAVPAAAAATGSADLQEFVSEKGIWPLLIGAALLVIVFVILARIGKAALRNVLEDQPPGTPPAGTNVSR